MEAIALKEREDQAAMEEYFPGRLGGLRERPLALDAYQEICYLDTCHRILPDMKEIPAMLGLALGLQELLCKEMSPE